MGRILTLGVPNSKPSNCHISLQMEFGISKLLYLLEMFLMTALSKNPSSNGRSVGSKPILLTDPLGDKASW